MISAWGVDHGEVSKAFVKLRPKLGFANMEDARVKRHVTMSEKLMRHANEHRITAGAQGRMAARMTPQNRKKFLNQPYRGKYTREGRRVDVLRQNKVGAQGMYDAIGREGRKNKVLP